MTDKKTPAGQTRTGVTRERSNPEGGPRGTEVPANPRLEVESVSLETEGGNRDSSPNPLDAGDQTPVTSQRRDSVVELGEVEE